MAYKYITENNLYEIQNYMYSEYGGLDFIKEYLDSRQDYCLYKGVKTLALRRNL